jgi:hypothetical protein
LAVADEIIDFYSSVLNGVLAHYSEAIGGKPIDVLIKPAIESTKEDHRFLEPVEARDGKIVMEEASADIEVMKNGFNSLTKAVIDSLGYVFGRDESIKRARSIYKEVSEERNQLVADAKIAEGLPAFLKEEIWEEV